MSGARAHLAAGRFVVLVAMVLVVAHARVAAAAAVPEADARAFNEKATAAFALGRFAEAAGYFEKAFELKTDPALLYNAAQAHRLAGNKERALTLYQSYLRVYGDKERRGEVEARIRELKEAIARDKAVATSPPTGTQPVTVPPSPPAPPPAAAAPPAPPAPVATATPTATAPAVAPLPATGTPTPASTS